MDYKNGKIYKILNTIDVDCYVGSTCQPLSKRMAKHRESMHNTVKKDRKLYAKMHELGVFNFYIELIEEFPCENIEQLRKREGESIRQLGTLNIQIAGRTRSETVKAYRETHSEQLKDYFKDYYKDYYNSNRERVLERQKQYYKENRDTINEYKSLKIECCCGSEVRQDNKARHEHTLKHQTIGRQ